jgi:hypothetical protein
VLVKDELRKLRTLNATKKMMQKAAADKGGKNRYGAKTKYEYGIYLRCQCLSRYLKIAVFATGQLKKGIQTPCYEIFLNPEGEEYITRVLENGKEVGWSTSSIDNLHNPEKNTFWWQCGWDAWMNPEGTKSIKRYLKTQKGGYEGIKEWQQKLTKQRIEERRKREVAPWDEDMVLIPKEPNGFRPWCQKEVCEQFIFYHYEKKGVKTGYCSYCEKDVPISKPKHNAKGTCPVCKHEIKYKADGKIKSLYTGRRRVQLIQSIKGGLVIRQYSVSKDYCCRAYTDPSYGIWEERRVLYLNGTRIEYSYELYKNSIMRWCRNGHRNEYRWYYAEHLVYKANIPALKRGALKRSSLPMVTAIRDKIDADRWLFCEMGNPTVEMLGKAGMLNMAIEMVNAPYKANLIDENATELAKILMIDNARLKRLKAADGGLTYLRWLKEEKSADTIYSDDMINDFEDAKITPENLEFISDRMSYLKIYNYLKKQQSILGDSLNKLMGTWVDYLDMAKKADMRVECEQIYKPKNLIEAHSEAIDLLEGKDMDETALKIIERFPKADDICTELTKYEWEDDEYMIIAPQGIRDIVYEGTKLKHCIHTCDRYIDRICTRESYLLFLRKKCAPKVPWYTLEVEPSGNIRQKRTLGDNQGKDFNDAIPFLKKWQQVVSKRLTAEDRKLGEESNKKRIEGYRQLRRDGNRIWHGVLQGKLLADVLEADFMGINESEEVKEILEVV